MDEELFFEVELEFSNDELESFIKNFASDTKYFKKPEELKRFILDFGNKIFLKYSTKTGYSVKTEFLRFDGQVASLLTDNVLRPERIIPLDRFLQKYFSSPNQSLVDVIKDEARERAPYRINFPQTPDVFIRNLFVGKIKILSEIRKRPTGTNTRVLESLDGGQVADVLSTIKNGNPQDRLKFDRIKQEFTRLFPNLRMEVTGGPSTVPQIVIEKKSIEYEVPIENIGAGIGEMIILLTHLIASKDMIFGLDMPEIQFHPHAQRILLKVIEENSKNNQIIIITHSTTLLDPRKLESISIVKELNGEARVRRLSDNYFEKDEKTKIERFLQSGNKDFFFSRATLIVEGPTEIGAIPIFAKALQHDFDVLGISLACTGKHFGLFAKLLRGFDIPYIVMGDKDALMNIEERIKIGEVKVKTCPVFCNLSKYNILEKEDLLKISEYQDQIVKADNKETYSDKLFEQLKEIANKYKVYILSSDFEGVLMNNGFQDALQEAAAISDSKVIQGIFVAEKIIQLGKKVPLELEAVINDVKELVS